MSAKVQVKIGAQLAGSFNSAFQAADAKINEVAGALRELYKTSGRIDAFKSLSRSVKYAEENLQGLHKRLELAQQKIKEKGKATTALTLVVEQWQTKIARASDTLGDQRHALSGLKATLEQAGVSTEHLGDAQGALQKKIAATTEELHAQKAQHLAAARLRVEQGGHEQAQRMRERLRERTERARARLADRAENARERAQRKAEATRQQVQRRAEQDHSMIGRSAFVGVLAAGAALANPLVFGQEMAKVNMLAKRTLNPEEQRSYNPRHLEQEILELTKKYTFSSTNIARTAGSFAQAGMKPLEIVNMLPVTLDVATATGDDPLEVGGLLRTLRSTFGIDGSNMTAMTRMSNVALAAASVSEMELSNLIESAQYLGGMPDMLGVKLEEMLGFLATVSDKHLLGSHAGTSGTQLLERLVDPVVQRKLAAQGLSITKRDPRTGKQELRPIISIWEDIARHMKRMNHQEKGAFMKIFGTEASRPLIPIAENFDLLKKNIQMLQEIPQSYSHELKTEAEDHAKAKIDKVVTALDVLSVKMTGLIKDDLSKNADTLSGLINSTTTWLEAHRDFSEVLVQTTVLLGAFGVGLGVKSLGGMLLPVLVNLHPLLQAIGVFVAAAPLFKYLLDKMPDGTFVGGPVADRRLPDGSWEEAPVGGRPSLQRASPLSWLTTPGALPAVNIPSTSTVTDQRTYTFDVKVASQPHMSTVEVGEEVSKQLKGLFREKEWALSHSLRGTSF